jgi:hypothetical protein
MDRATAGLLTPDAYHMRAAVPPRHQTDCGEKRDPDERQRPKRNKENGLDLNNQLEKRSFDKKFQELCPEMCFKVGSADKTGVRHHGKTLELFQL